MCEPAAVIGMDGSGKIGIKKKCRIIRLIIAIVFFVIGLGYIPRIKRYLPRKLVQKPLILETNMSLEERKCSGEFEKHFLSTILPFVPQKGTIRFVPHSLPDVKSLEVKGAGGGRMRITNLDDYRGDEDILFRGKPITHEKRFESSAGLRIAIFKRGFSYICQTNKKNEEE